MKTKKFAWNTISSLVFQVCAIICGFVLPRLILQQYGSELNGLINSITEFLAFISVLELGVGAVVMSALYKPLAEQDNDTISKIITSAGKFFKRIGLMLFVYVIVLILVYPLIAKQNYSYFYNGLLILSISISSFAQYYFGVVDRLLLLADQRGYVQNNALIITLIINTLASIILIKYEIPIHIVKLSTSLIYLARPLALRWYVNKHYKINRKAVYNEEPIEQKWNGIAQHICSVVLDQTDIIVLTVMTTLSQVSIYSIYFLVLSGVKKIFLSMTFGIESLLGELWAKRELSELMETFKWIEWMLHTIVTFGFGCTASLIVPFVQVFTLHISDVNYVQPLFGGLLVLAHAFHCYRLPYNIMIKATGMYKETQVCFIVATILNVGISIIMVENYGLIGVTIGTLVAMIYQTIWMAVFNSKNMIKWPFKNFAIQICLDGLIIIPCFYFSSRFEMPIINALNWTVLALKVISVWFIGSLIINIIFKKEMMFKLIKTCLKRLKSSNLRCTYD
ncbi:sugar isomerase [Clostridiaceae bacterium HFYG-1003]|nr:sugar isomerase [Clostridiaceae bacterium HFYG-1003]